MTDEQRSVSDIHEYLAQRDALFLNPTLEAAVKLFNERWPGQTWQRPDVPLAALHKARLQWIHATDAMLEESIRWLEANDYRIEHMGAPPFTPTTRDYERMQRGLKPLRGKT